MTNKSVKSVVLEYTIIILLVLLVWDFIARLRLPILSEELDLYNKEQRDFVNEEGIGRVEYMRKTQYNLQRVMDKLGMVAEEPYNDDENKSSSTPGKQRATP